MFVLKMPIIACALHCNLNHAIAVFTVYTIYCGSKSGLLCTVNLIKKISLNCRVRTNVPHYYTSLLKAACISRPLRTQGIYCR